MAEDSAFYLMGVMVGQSINGKVAATDLASVDADKGAKLVGFMQAGAGATSRTVLDKLRDTVSAKDFGAVGDGIADDTAALVAFGNAVAGKKIIPPGRYKVTQMISFRPGDVVEGAGSSSVIDASSFPGDAVFSVAGSLQSLPALGATAAIGDQTVAFASAHGLAVGDVFVIYNPTAYSFSPYRANYRAGEWCRVAQVVSETSVRVYSTLYGTYTSGSVTVHKLVGERTMFRDFRVIQPATGNLALQVSLIDSPVVENIQTGGSTYAGIELDRCVDFYANGGALQGPYLSGDQYGLAISNCQGGEIHGSYHAGKHAILFGGGDATGSVPTRAVTVYSPVLGGAGATANQDLHGNTEDITFIGGIYYNGGQISGKNHKFIGCSFKGYGNSGISLYTGEPVSGDFIFEACKFESSINPNASNYGVIDLQAFGSNVSGECTVMFNNCVISAPGASTYPVRVGLNGTNHKLNILFDGIHLKGGGATQFIRANKSAGSGSLGTVRIKSISGLPSGAEFFVVAAGSPGGTFQLPDQHGVVSVPAVISAASAALTVTFRNAYPAAPTVVASNMDGTMGSRPFIASGTSVTGQGFSAAGNTTDGSAFTSTNAGRISWVAKMDAL